MDEITVSQARARLAGVDAHDPDQLISIAEDLADLRAAAQAREEMECTGREPIPWDQVKADLGLT